MPEPKVIDSLTAFDICKAGCGNRHSICLSACGKVFTWGKGDRDMRASSNDYFDPIDPFDNQKFKKEELSFIEISAGVTHSAAVTSTGELYMWGDCSEGC